MNSLESLVEFGGGIKVLAEEPDRLKIGGYAVLYGTPDTADMSPTRDYFTKSTDFGLDVATKGRVRWHHGLDPAIGRSVLGLVDFKAQDDVGIWAEGWISRTTAYEKKVAEWVKSGKTGFSTGVPAHCVGRKEVDGANEITEWCLGADVSITLTPADPRQPGQVRAMKSLMGESDMATETAAEPAADCPYGMCPMCGAPGKSRERRPDGNDTCENGHVYPSKDAVEADASPSTSRITEPAADTAKSLVECSDRLVADLDELVPRWERAHAARQSAGRDLSPEKLATLAALKALTDRVGALADAAIEPPVDREAISAACREADELLASLT